MIVACVRVACPWYEKYKVFLNLVILLSDKLEDRMVQVRVTCLCVENLEFFTSNLYLGDLPVIHDRAIFSWCEKYQGFFMDGLCLGNEPVVRDRVTYPSCENI